MQMGSKPGYHNPLPLGITPSSVFQYIYNLHIKFQNFCRSQVQLFTWTFRTKPLSFHKILLLVLSFWLIPKSRNFVAATLFMFPRWAIPAVMMSYAFPTFRWLLHLYLLNFLWVFMPGTFLNGSLGRVSHHWSTFLSFTDCSQKAFYLLL